MTKLVYGVGFNSKPDFKAIANTRHPTAYRTWVDMLRRCYCDKFQKLKPAYVGCLVADEWHDFHSFYCWYSTQRYNNAGYQLDKDLMVIDNKTYGPKSCCFIPQELNKLIVFKRSSNSSLGYGVCFEKQSGKYKAQLSIGRKRLTLGRFDYPDEAHQAYKEAKERHVKNRALAWANRIDWDVFVALMNWTLES